MKIFYFLTNIVGKLNTAQNASMPYVSLQKLQFIYARVWIGPLWNLLDRLYLSH